MLYALNRVILDRSGTPADLSDLLSDPFEGVQSLSIVHGTDKLYIGSDLPFAQRFLLLGSAKNTVNGSVTVQIWDGSEWVEAVDVRDGTKVDGKPFAKSGLITFRPASDSGWGIMPDTADVTELEDLNIFNTYWARLSFSADFAFDLEYVGFRFAKDSDLKAYYQDLLRPEVMKAFNQNTAMLSWDRQHCVAAEEIIERLRKDGTIVSGNQVLDPAVLNIAAVHKLAMIAYSSFGEGREGRYEFARDSYREAMSRKVFNFDRNGDGKEDRSERASDSTLRRV